MSKIIPAILTDKPQDLEKMIRVSEQFTDYVQIDIMDAKFVPSKSITALDLAKIKTNLFLEAHLMVKNPEDYIQDFKDAGAKKIIFHFEATADPAAAIQKIRDADLAVGLAINPPTALREIASLIDKVDMVLFLAVNPGFYGSKFIPEVLDKIREFKKLYPTVKTGIDGGIKQENIDRIAPVNIDYICVGSAIFAHDNPHDNYLLFQQKISLIKK